MADVESDLARFEARYDDVDVEAILARCERRGPLTTFSRRRCLYQAPEFVKRLPAEETVQEGTTVRFDCKIQGFPKPTVTWYKDDEVVCEDARAALESDEHDMYSIIFHDISKCDAGTYRVRASNLEGSSANSLYIAVKAKSRMKIKKKTRTKNRVVTAPLFPVIVEREAEERRETLAVEQQKDSPLTPLYCNISMKSPVSWPEFLGEWAYSAQAEHLGGDGLDLGDEDSDEGSEDVFDTDDSPCQTSVHLDPDPGPHAGTDINLSSAGSDNTPGIVDREHVTKAVELCLCDNGVQSHPARRPHNLSIQELNLRNTIKTAADTQSDKQNVDSPSDIINNNLLSKTVGLPPMQLEDKTMYAGPATISKISVNRSYARGDTASTFSVAVRSSSPYYAANIVSSQNCHLRDSGAVDTQMQNINNERLLSSRKHTRQAPVIPWNDQIAEFVLLITSCTCIELLLQVPPTAFIVHVFMAMLAKVMFDILLNDV